ncbi:cytochrome c oxidase subunit 3 [Novosphingobium sp. Chol11]|jgi:cytochrome c oxidase subunit III|uniref:cytochrome c oxidase subunit 3 n=1 Tax=Novosphingobium sp. Chol11 TaxID=1385763 RepID=UPI000BE2A824|nr:cytochrome oxidase subunit III [Novosphingobium sp. Chol11]
MTILARLAEKSWEPASDRDPAASSGPRPSAGGIGLGVYFAVALVMFSLLGAAYVMRMGLHASMGHADDWVAVPDPPLLWINSGILAASSIAWEIARRSFDNGRTVRAAATGTALGLAFLIGQWLLWRHYLAQGHYLSSNPANAFFYLLTALHGLHILGGLVAAAWVLAAHNLLNVRLCAIYWHFLLFIWILIAALLVST